MNETSRGIQCCLICGEHVPEDFGPYTGEEAICCLECWQELYEEGERKEAK